MPPIQRQEIGLKEKGFSRPRLNSTLKRARTWITYGILDTYFGTEPLFPEMRVFPQCKREVVAFLGLSR